jgi:hypothetical protein
LYTSGAKKGDAADQIKMEHVNLKYDDNGKEVLVPVKQTSYEEQKEVRRV